MPTLVRGTTNNIAFDTTNNSYTVYGPEVWKVTGPNGYTATDTDVHGWSPVGIYSGGGEDQLQIHVPCGIAVGDYTAYYVDNISGGSYPKTARKRTVTFSVSGEDCEPPDTTAICGPMDVAFCIDDTGSMGSAIASVAGQIPALLDQIEASSDGDYRCKLVRFGVGFTTRVPFGANNRAAIESAVAQLTADGGAGGPEDSDLALNDIINGIQEFREDANKIIILITDALPAGGDDVYTPQIDGPAAHGLAEDAALKDIKICAVYVPTYNPEFTWIQEIMQYYAETTGGIFTQTDAAGNGVADAIKDILTNCGGDPPEPPPDEDDPCCHDGRTISDLLEAHFNLPDGYRALLWKVTPKGKAPEGHTAWDENLVFDDGDGELTYSHIGGAMASEIEVNIGLNVDAINMQTLLRLSGVTLPQILSGRYKEAMVAVYACNPDDLTQGKVTLFGGVLGNYTLTDTSVNFELKTLTEAVNRNYGRLTRGRCPWRFGYWRCENSEENGGLGDGPSIADHQASGALGTYTDPLHVSVAGVTQIEDWATNGFLRFIGGAFDGFEVRIKKWEADGANVYLNQPLPFVPDAGYTVVVEEGCDNTFSGARGCKFHENAVNFGGHPWLPTELISKVNDGSGEDPDYEV